MKDALRYKLHEVTQGIATDAILLATSKNWTCTQELKYKEHIGSCDMNITKACALPDVISIIPDYEMESIGRTGGTTLSRWIWGTTY